MAHKAKLSYETYNEEYVDPREDDLGRGKYLKFIVKTDVIRTPVGTNRAKALAKGDRECVEDVHRWRKPLCEPFIAALRSIQFVGFPLKYGENGIRRVTSFDLLRERMGNKFFSGLPLVFLQSLIEDWLKIWSS